MDNELARLRGPDAEFNPILHRSPDLDIYPWFFACHARSGSRFVAQSLENKGMRIGHEQYFSDGIVSWPHVGQGKVWWLPGEVKPEKHAKVVHLVRRPLNVIASCAYTEDIRALEFLKENLGDLVPDVPQDEDWLERIRFYMASWIFWNRKIEQEHKPIARFRVERMPFEWSQWIEVIGPPLDRDTRPPFQPPVKRNTKLHADVTWEDLDKIDSSLAKSASNMAEEYGYAGC